MEKDNLVKACGKKDCIGEFECIIQSEKVKKILDPFAPGAYENSESGLKVATNRIQCAVNRLARS